MHTTADVRLSFIHISDTHINPDTTYVKDYAPITPLIGARALVAELNRLPFQPDFILHTGDVAYDPVPEAYAACHDLLSALRVPVYYVAGNHDDPIALQRVLMNRAEPLPILSETFEVNGVQIVCVDSNGPATPPAGFVRPEQLEWLEGLCRADDNRPMVIAVHHNMLPVQVPWLDTYMRTSNGEDFHRALLPARHRIRGVFYGHVHQNLDTVRDGILYSSTLSSWCQFHAYPGMADTTSDAGAEPGYSIVTVTNDQTFIRRCRFGQPTAG